MWYIDTEGEEIGEAQSKADETAMLAIRLLF